MGVVDTDAREHGSGDGVFAEPGCLGGGSFTPSSPEAFGRMERGGATKGKLTAVAAIAVAAGVAAAVVTAKAAARVAMVAAGLVASGTVAATAGQRLQWT